jgi:hypothetical protein
LDGGCGGAALDLAPLMVGKQHGGEPLDKYLVQRIAPMNWLVDASP